MADATRSPPKVVKVGVEIAYYDSHGRKRKRTLQLPPAERISVRAFFYVQQVREVEVPIVRTTEEIPLPVEPVEPRTHVEGCALDPTHEGPCSGYDPAEFSEMGDSSRGSP